MAERHNLDCFDEFTARFIRAKVRQLIGRAGIRESDRDDLLQDFALDLIQRRKNFDPEAATWQAFVVVVCENRYATILEHRRAAKRSRDREGGSLNQPVRTECGGQADLGSTVTDAQHELRTGRRRRSPEESADLALDIANVLERLPSHLREICEHMKHASKSAVNRHLGVSTGAFYELIAQIRQRFEQAGLREYL